MLGPLSNCCQFTYPYMDPMQEPLPRSWCSSVIWPPLPTTPPPRTLSSRYVPHDPLPYLNPCRVRRFPFTSSSLSHRPVLFISRLLVALTVLSLQQLKPRALSGDVRLLAAKQAYDQRQDKEDLLSTLRILASRSNGNSMDTN